MPPSALRTTTLLALAAAALGAPATPSAHAAASLRTDRAQPTLKADAARYALHLNAIAGPLSLDRVPGSPSHAAAADYIVRTLRDASLEGPIPHAPTADPTDASNANQNRFRLPFTRPGPLEIRRQSLTLHLPAGDVPLQPAAGFNPIGHSGSGDVERAPVTFAGYAITIADDGYASFAVNDRFRSTNLPDDHPDDNAAVAVILTHEPLDEDGYSYYHDRLGEWTYLCSISAKLAAVERRGAAAALLVTAPGVNDPDAQDPLRFDPRAPGRFDHFPAAAIAREHADQLVNAAFPNGPDLLTLRNNADLEGGLTPLPNVAVSIDLDLEETELDAPILLARLPGVGNLAREHILVLAHYDAAPPRQQFTPKPAAVPDRSPRPALPAANTHGSPPAAALLAAQRLAESLLDDPLAAPRRSVLFAFLSDGALRDPRSLKHLFDHTPVPLAHLAAVVTLGPVGKPTDNQAFILGARTAPQFQHALPRILDRTDLIVSTEALPPRDPVHRALTARRLPTLHLTTGADPFAGQPQDTTDRVDTRDAARVARLLADTILALAATPQRPRYVRPNDPNDPTPARAFLGLRPRAADFLEDPGVYVAALTPEGPAQRAGLQPGDRIAEWNGQPVDSIADYAQFINDATPGATVNLTIERDGETLNLAVTLDSSG